MTLSVLRIWDYNYLSLCFLWGCHLNIRVSRDRASEEVTTFTLASPFVHAWGSQLYTSFKFKVEPKRRSSRIFCAYNSISIQSVRTEILCATHNQTTRIHQHLLNDYSSTFASPSLVVRKQLSSYLSSSPIAPQQGNERCPVPFTKVDARSIRPSSRRGDDTRGRRF